MIEIYNEQVRDLLVSDGVNKRYPSQYLIIYILMIFTILLLDILNVWQQTLLYYNFLSEVKLCVFTQCVDLNLSCLKP